MKSNKKGIININSPEQYLTVLEEGKNIPDAAYDERKSTLEDYDAI